MNRILLITLFVFGIWLSSSAQSPEFKVSSFSHQANNLAARINERLDVNDNAAALILVRTSEKGVGFEAGTGIVGIVVWKKGDYWLYVSEGTRIVKVFKQGIKTTEYRLSPIPKSRETYLMVVDVIRPEPKVAIIPVTIITTPDNASLSIDGKNVDNLKKSHKLTEGQHTILVEMQGYETMQQNIDVNSDNAYFTFKLSEIANAALMIETIPAVADVYLDGVKLGQSPISAFYPPGTYAVKIIKEGYVSIENQSLTVTPPETRKTFTLDENVGLITINTFETAKVYINGQEYPDTKNIKLFPQLLNIRVSMPKAEDIEKQLVLKRNDNLNIDLYPDAATATLQIAVTPFDAQIELSGDAGENYSATGMKIFNDIPIGQYTIKVIAEGYGSQTRTISLTANQLATQNIKLEAGPSGDIEMALVKGGTFQMGSNGGEDDEKPIHSVSLSDFYIGRYEVTQKQWKEIMGNIPSRFSGCGDCPVEQVSWNDVQEFLKKLNQKTGMNYRLPTEAEWEYAARGGNKGRNYKYSGGNNIDDVAWHYGNSGSQTHPVGQKNANELGIYDMSGNVWEWCGDWYGGSRYYKKSPGNNPQGPSSGAGRVCRGGGWYDGAVNCRVAYRNRWFPGDGINGLGFRLARSVP